MTAPGSDTPDTGTDDHLLVTDNGSESCGLNRSESAQCHAREIANELEAAISAADRDGV